MYFIFQVRITDPEYTADDYARAWLRASKIIQQAPGAQGTRLHRKIDAPSTLLAIATWNSKASRDAMERTASEEIAAIIATQMPHVQIELIGEFESPEWEVLPDPKGPEQPSR